MPSGSNRIYDRLYASGKSATVSPTGGLIAYNDTLEGSVTNLQFMSVNGTSALVGGTDKGAIGLIGTSPLGGLNIRRLNWRELQTVD